MGTPARAGELDTSSDLCCWPSYGTAGQEAGAALAACSPLGSGDPAPATGTLTQERLQSRATCAEEVVPTVGAFWRIFFASSLARWTGCPLLAEKEYIAMACERSDAVLQKEWYWCAPSLPGDEEQDTARDNNQKICSKGALLTWTIYKYAHLSGKALQPWSQSTRLVKPLLNGYWNSFLGDEEFNSGSGL